MEQVGGQTIHWIDLTIIGVYLVAITAIGLLVSRRQGQTSQGYFLAGRSLRWPMIGLALFATNISTVHLVGLASSGYGDGLVVGNFEWMAASCLILLGLIFAPFYFRNRISTLPEYLERRYSPGSRTFLAFMAVVGALFIHIGVGLYAGSKVLEHFFAIDIYLSIILVAGLTVLYTVLGGLKAVVVTESIQTFLLLIGALAVTLFGLQALGEAGIGSLEELRAAVKPDQLSMVHREGGLAWYAILLGYPVLGIWYWCADQTIVQRVLGAQTQRDAQLGPLFAGFIKILPVFIMVLPGVMAYALFRDEIGDQADQVLPFLIDAWIPVGLKGLIAAGLLAALMSTVAGALNSASTLVSLDIARRLRPDMEDDQLVRIGRITACVVMVLATLWSTQGEHFGGIFNAVNAMIACLAPPITVVFIWGVFWRRGTQQAALWTLIVGFVLGAAVFVADFPALGFEIITQEWNIPFMMQAWWLFVICSCLYVVVSLLTPPPEPRQLEGLCWERPLAALAGPLQKGSDPRLVAGILLGVMIILYIIFA
ncbi:MAG: sodium/solute symporter [Candidatus Latescibacteria bacterium]|nr:sodium/solute symporter [Candidatus Latescibacterota bacterium]